MTIGDMIRQGLFELNEARLCELAERAAQKGPGFSVICIGVDDPAWRALVALLMPSHDWDQYRQRGEIPVARGVVPVRVLNEVAAQCGLTLPATDGRLIAVLDAGGASFYDSAHV